MPRLQTTEDIRLEDNRTRKEYWKRWGPYLSERQWGTVREDYSANGTAWEFFPHDHARSRAYRWGEDGIGGISDRHQMICFALAMWNGRDPILKERLFGLTGNRRQSRRGRKGILFLSGFHSHPQLHEDALQVSAGGISVPQAGRRESTARPNDPEFELLDTGVFRRKPLFRCVRGVRQGQTTKTF